MATSETATQYLSHRPYICIKIHCGMFGYQPITEKLIHLKLVEEEARQGKGRDPSALPLGPPYCFLPIRRVKTCKQDINFTIIIWTISFFSSFSTTGNQTLGGKVFLLAFLSFSLCPFHFLSLHHICNLTQFEWYEGRKWTGGTMSLCMHSAEPLKRERKTSGGPKQNKICTNTSLTILSFHPASQLQKVRATCIYKTPLTCM